MVRRIGSRRRSRTIKRKTRGIRKRNGRRQRKRRTDRGRREGSVSYYDVPDAITEHLAQ